jgi:hypothetical protein
LQPVTLPGGAQLSGVFLAIKVSLRVIGLPGTAKMPPPWPAVLPVTWLRVRVSGPPGAGPLGVMVASKIPPPCPDAVLPRIWLVVMARMPPLTAPGATRPRLMLAMPPPMP